MPARHMSLPTIRFPEADMKERLLSTREGVGETSGQGPDRSFGRACSGRKRSGRRNWFSSFGSGLNDPKISLKLPSARAVALSGSEARGPGSLSASGRNVKSVLTCSPTPSFRAGLTETYPTETYPTKTYPTKTCLTKTCLTKTCLTKTCLTKT
jgi:hypothetical protein